MATRIDRARERAQIREFNRDQRTIAHITGTPCEPVTGEPGRPNPNRKKLSRETLDYAAAFMAAPGSSVKALARSLGITPKAIRNWMRSSRASPGRYLCDCPDGVTRPFDEMMKLCRWEPPRRSLPPVRPYEEMRAPSVMRVPPVPEAGAQVSLDEPAVTAKSATVTRVCDQDAYAAMRDAQSSPRASQSHHNGHPDRSWDREAQSEGTGSGMKTATFVKPGQSTVIGGKVAIKVDGPMLRPHERIPADRPQPQAFDIRGPNAWWRTH